MATAGPNSGSTFADDAGVGTVAWTNPGNAAASDDSRAEATLTGTHSHYLKATGFGFSIPAGATINGITVEIERHYTTIGVFDNRIRLVRAGTIESTNKTIGAWPNGTDAYQTAGSSSDLWGSSWSSTDINDSGFGVAIAATGFGPGAGTAKIDHIRITVNYTVGGVIPVLMNQYRQRRN